MSESNDAGLEQRLDGHGHPDEEDHERAGNGKETTQTRLKAKSGEDAPCVDEQQSNGSERPGETDAKRDDKHHAETRALQ